MDFVDKLNRLIGLYASVLKTVFRLKIWLPYFLYAVLQFGVLIAFANYVHPSIYPILSPLAALMGGARAELFSHYPGLYLLLPLVYQWGKLAVGILFEGLATGLTVVLFTHLFGRRLSLQWKFSEVFARWPQLLLGWTFITAILFVLHWFLPEIVSDFIQGSPRRAALFDIGLRALTVVIYSIFIYTLPALIVYRQNIFKAFKTSIGFFVKYPIFSFFLVLIPYLFTLPFSYLSRSSDMIVARFSPELVYYVLLIGIIIGLFVNYFIAGAVTKFLIEEKE